MSRRTSPEKMQGAVVAVSANRSHAFSKTPGMQITLLAGLGVEGDAHCGVTVKHRSRVARDPRQPNLRQVHLLHSELFDELRGAGHTVLPGELGENITTEGVQLLGLPAGTQVHIGDTAIVRLTGLRNPCAQIDRFHRGLLAATLGRTRDGKLVRKAGVMGVVVAGGVVCPGDRITWELPAPPHDALEPV